MEVWLSHLWSAVGWGLVAVTAVGSVELLVLTLAAVPRRDRPRRGAGDALRLAVVVPAHDEAAEVGGAVRSLRASAGDAPCEIVVVAHNCSDDTASVAAAAGARVLVLDDADRRGKSFALDHALRTLLDEDFDAFAIVDADTDVDLGFVASLQDAFAAGADAVQARYLGRVGGGDGDRRRPRPKQLLRAIGFAAMNVVRPRGRERLGLSVGIFGNGFALSRATVLAVPYDVHSIAEDLAYHIRLVRSGRRVRLVDEVAVRGDLPDGASAARVQSARWEGGRLRAAREELPRLLKDVLRGRWRALEPAADLALLPLGYHVALLVLATLIGPGPFVRLYGAIALAVVVLHVAVATRASGVAGLRAVVALSTVPLYVLWKLGLMRAVFRGARRDAAWVRTPRDAEN